ncbi:MAG TPA: M1 family metallopeptidase [Flavobacteriaceae bacterium]|nr:M1 family metallopeptidase [Flavobacteriaceae bacterium]
MLKKLGLLFLLLFSFGLTHAQQTATRADSLRGGLRPERTNFDILKYDLSVEVDPEKKYISGNNNITFKVLENANRMQLDLFENMQIDSIIFQGENLFYEREYNAVIIDFPTTLPKGMTTNLDFYYSGNPIIAENPPWDGGFIFTKDLTGKDWISVAVQGTGASLWYPNKDHRSDKPEEAEIHVTAPQGLMNVSNGRFTGKKELPDGRTTWSYKVSYPINNYNLILNIGDYVHFSDQFEDIDLDYYVMPYNLIKAKKQFEEVKDMLACFTDKFGEYPFKKDGYKIIESPYLGMEHQSGIAYGNDFRNGYNGRDISNSGVGRKFDFIIIHESGHEWFGNSITAADIADMWIQEGFTSYAEIVYIECRWGKQDALKYLNGLRRTRIENKEPIIGEYGINKTGSGDMYYKGANMLHTIRTAIDDDKKWWKMLKDLNKKLKYQSTNSEEVIDFLNQQTELNLKPIFEQYLNFTKIPELQFKKDKGEIFYRWEADAVNFEMPINIGISGKSKRIYVTKYWQKLDQKADLRKISADEINNYINFRVFK